jgi:hypothetical protein
MLRRFPCFPAEQTRRLCQTSQSGEASPHSKKAK